MKILVFMQGYVTVICLSEDIFVKRVPIKHHQKYDCATEIVLLRDESVFPNLGWVR